MNKNKTYQSMADLVHDVSEDKEVGAKISRDLSEQAIVHLLFGMRSARGVSQAEMASKLKCSQSRISKLENSKDDELTVGELRSYLRALDHDLIFAICKSQWTLVERIKFHACMIRDSLIRMVDMATNDNTIRDGVTNFHVEAFYNLVKIVLTSAKNIPQTSEPPPSIVEAEQDNCAEGDSAVHHLALSN